MAKGAGASPNDYTVFSLVVIVLGGGLGLWLLWDSHHAEISAGLIQLFHWQIEGLRLFTDRFDLADRQMLATDPAYVEAGTLIRMARSIGSYVLYPAVGFVLWLGLIAFLYAAASRYCRRFDLDRLMREQALTWRGILPFVERKLRLVPLARNGVRPLDPALTVEEWVRLHASDRDGGFDEEAARTELNRQLGSPWQGVRTASPAVRCMLAAIALHGAARREEAQTLLGDYAAGFAEPGREDGAGPAKPLSFPPALVRRADAILKDRTLLFAVLPEESRHAYATPVLMSALTQARAQAGILAPAQFSFLKFVDRRLWYALHSLGFPSAGQGYTVHPNPRVEAIGARDHWATECAIGKPLTKPAMEQALRAIRDAFEMQGAQNSSMG